MTDAEADKIAAELLDRLNAELWETIAGPTPTQPMTVLRYVNGRFESVPIDNEGRIVEPVRCTCRGVVVGDLDCPVHKGSFGT